MNEIIRAAHLHRRYIMNKNAVEEGDVIRVLKDVSLTVEEGEFVAIMGKSGCGKTTLIKTLGLIDLPDEGEVYFGQKDTTTLWDEELADIRRRKIGFVFQDFYLMESLSVRENIMLPMILDKADAAQCKDRAISLAEHFEIAHLLDKNTYELSGGEKQRVAISRALINNPDVILADEPTGNLDSKSGKIVIEEFKHINSDMGKTIIMVTHDPFMASQCRRVIFLKDGVILSDIRNSGTQEEFYHEILGHMEAL